MCLPRMARSLRIGGWPDWSRRGLARWEQAEPVKFHKFARWEQAEPGEFHKVALGLINGRIEVVSDHSYAETSGDRSRFIRDAVLVVGAEDVRRLASLRAAERDAKARFRGSHESHERTRLDHARHSANLTALYERHTACFNRLLHWRPPISGAERSALGYREALGWRLSHTIEVASRLRCNGSCRRPVGSTSGKRGPSLGGCVPSGRQGDFCARPGLAATRRSRSRRVCGRGP